MIEILRNYSLASGGFGWGWGFYNGGIKNSTLVNNVSYTDFVTPLCYGKEESGFNVYVPNSYYERKEYKDKITKKCVYNCFHQETAPFSHLPCLVISHNMMPLFVTQVLKGTPLCGSTVMKYTATNVCIEIMFKDLYPTFYVKYCRVDRKRFNKCK
jgi:hypothetical protein